MKAGGQGAFRECFATSFCKIATLLLQEIAKAFQELFFIVSGMSRAKANFRKVAEFFRNS
jgi:hypothetical protein